MKQGSKKWIDIGTLFVVLASLVVINVLGSFVFERIDLTAEKRYTLSNTTVSELKSLDDVVFVRIYLDGNLPSEFRELRDAVKETLDEMRAYAGGNLEYEFINPSASADEKERIEMYQSLTKQGLTYTNIRLRSEDKVSEQIIFPGAIMAFGGSETPIQLLKSRAGATQQSMIASSIQQLEYEFVTALRKLRTTHTKRIAFIEGHGELDALETADAERALSEFYSVERITINEQLDALKGIWAVIIAQPDSAFSEKDKFIIDQFVMNGGKVLWCIDPVFARMDSLRNSQFTMGMVLDHNLTDQLFKYGARLNSDLIMDIEALPIPIVTGMIGNQPNYEMFKWYYMPLLMGNDQHPISRNLDRMKSEFASTIDPIEVDSVRHTALLTSSEKSRTVNAPTRISFNILRESPQYELFNTGPHTAAMLLEGKFESVFKNRLPKQITEGKEFNYKDRSVENKMIVISDADLIRNEVNRRDEKFYALGYYKYTEEVYGNREFILNAMNYLLNDDGLLDIRSKEFKIRLLDQAKVDKQRYFWQTLNTAVPIMLIFCFGMIRIWWRKKLYVK